VGTWNGIELTDVELTGYGMRLRRLRDSDTDAVLRAMNDPRMQKGWLPLPDPYQRADAEAFVGSLAQNDAAQGTGFQLAMVAGIADTLLGSIGLRLPTDRGVRAEIGYAVYPDGQGNGYAALASRLVAGWAFDHGLRSIVIRCAVENQASVKSALNAGFRYEGTARQALLTPGPVSDAAMFGRTADDADGPVPRSFTALPASGLTDGTITLRTISPDDATAVVEDRDDIEYRRWAFHDHPATTIAWARQHAADAALDWLVGRSATMTIVDGATGLPAGFITVRQAGPPGVGGIGYSVLPAFRGRGYTARALRLVRVWALTEGGLHRLELGAKADNVASQRAARSGGFRPDGVRAERLRNPDGSYSDEVRFVSLTARD
jgi:RimJ/RimL family protein N-acetyltransferase